VRSAQDGAVPRSAVLRCALHCSPLCGPGGKDDGWRECFPPSGSAAGPVAHCSCTHTSITDKPGLSLIISEWRSIRDGQVPFELEGVCGEHERILQVSHFVRLSLTGLFRELRTSEEYADVTLACEDGQQIDAHKIVLSACSPFFQVNFLSDQVKQLATAGAVEEEPAPAPADLHARDEKLGPCQPARLHVLWRDRDLPGKNPKQILKHPKINNFISG
jgi:hypothetical protein